MDHIYIHLCLVNYVWAGVRVHVRVCKCVCEFNCIGVELIRDIWFIVIQLHVNA